MKFLIADDELLVRITVQNNLNKLGIMNEDIYQVSCGEAMVRILETEYINIAFVDIKMPDINGLQAIEKCLQIASHTSFYILTGFEKFEYATTAIRLGVKDFLLKPLDLQTLTEILEREYSNFSIISTNQTNYYIAQITDALFGKLDFEQKNDFYCLPCLFITEQEDEWSWKPLHSIESIYPQIQTIHITNHLESYVVFCNVTETVPQIIYSDIKNLLAQMLKQNKTETLTIIYNHKFVPLSKLRNTYSSIRKYSNIRLLNGIHKLYLYHEKLASFSRVEKEFTTLLLNFVNSFNENQYIECQNIITKITTFLSISNLMLKNYYQTNVTLYLSKAISDTSISFGKEQTLIEYLNTLSDSLLNRENNAFQIQNVISFIEEHYTEEISIATISSAFHISPNYLSSRFKKTFGMKFTEYVTILRISQAKKLLVETNMQTQEIASTIGYLSTSHFIRTFVKQIGSTPLEYRANEKTNLH